MWSLVLKYEVISGYVSCWSLGYVVGMGDEVCDLDLHGAWSWRMVLGLYLDFGMEIWGWPYEV